jgi:peptidoglycan/xylan/chitin deacetylase (PgdA/CDA1 family)
MLQTLIDGALHKAARHTRSKPFTMRNRAPLVTFTFDDVPDSAYVNGATILEQHGFHGTFYIATGILGRRDEHWRVIDRDQVRDLYARGHEIGCHTYSHVAIDRLDASAMDEECRRNSKMLHELCPGIEVANFCAPFGKISLPRKLQLANRFDTCRGIYEGINRGTVDLALLRIVDLYDRTLTREKRDRVLRETIERNGWLIFCVHDVADPPSWIGSSTRLFRETVKTVQAAGLECLTIRDALDAIGYTGKTGVSAAAATARS